MHDTRIFTLCNHKLFHNVQTRGMIWSKRGTLKINPLQWNDFECTSLPILIPCLKFTIEIESNSLMYNPNKEIRNREYPIKIGKFSVKYYTF